ncbi:MAG: helix-turn-helix transcriptional regulator [Microvirga sp.]
MNGDADLPDGLGSAAPIFAALGDPIRLSIIGQLCESGPLPTVRLQGASRGVSRQGLTKHLRVLEDAGLVDSVRIGRDRQWRLQPRRIAMLRQHLEDVSAAWDGRIERLRAFVEDPGT